ncbi:MAG: hypothetical protein CMP76_10575 [Flavobacterium sp.]|uniref:DUF4252 domain-containing protein n=1 Tax=unclassified Flavobacterium TaxID=196869 RepID=UPI000C4E7F14|nr:MULTISPECIES: DUF4252 domain-containing protein [unclassified Flavobacterium]MBF03730.1 hypothetical protein [Flavobacterium sp.]MCO6162942.1 DUF4252 domain-containing protein [Flavobacterium sp. NRK F7]|tara:strand:+ start:1380 stop:1811 length:432 start_codon:yes stop_codon:yes gene_type:complete
MKNLFCTLVFLCSVNLFFGQSFKKFENNKEVSSFVINKDLFSDIEINTKGKDQEEKKIIDFLKKIEFVKVFSTSNEALRSDMKSVAKKYKKNKSLEQLMKYSANGNEASFLIKTNKKDELEELMIFVEGSGKNDSVLILFSLS